MKISHKLLFMVSIPIIGLLYFMANQTIEKYVAVKEINLLQQFTNASIRSSALIHELQKERGMSAGFLGNKNDKFFKKLQKQRVATDEEIKKTENLLKTINNVEPIINTIKNVKNNVINELDKITTIRKEVDEFAISVGEELEYYSNIIDQIFIIIKRMFKISPNIKLSDANIEFSNMITAYINLMQAKEKAGLERATLSNTFNRGYFSPGMYERFILLLVSQNIYTNTFLSFANSNQKEFYNNTIQGKVVDEIKKIREVALKKELKYKLNADLFKFTGIGGLIYQFNNYILSGDLKYFDMFSKHYENLQNVIRNYKSLPNVSDTDLGNINILQKTFGKFKENLSKIDELKTRQKNAEEIYSVVKVDEESAIKATRELFGGGNLGVDPIHWWDVITVKINLLKTVEDYISNNLKECSDEFKKKALLIFKSYLIIISVAILLTIFLSYLIARSITHPLKKLVKASNKISEGNRDIIIEATSNDEIGELSNAMRHMLSSIKEVEKELCNSRDEMELRVQDRTRTLSKLNKQMEVEISERKTVEEKIHKLSQAVEQSPVSVMITDTKGDIEYVNSKFCQLTGYTIEEVIGKNPRFLQSGKTDPVNYKELWDNITFDSEWVGELHNRKKSGDLYWELASISPIKNQKNEITHFLAVKEDITHRKHIENELSMERLSLESKVQKRTNELQKSLGKLREMNVQLIKAKQAERKFLSFMSHELRTPLNGILGYTDLLRGKAYGELNENQREFAEEIDISGKHLLLLINDLLDVAKIDADRMELHVEEISSKEFIEIAASMMKMEFHKKNISFNVSLDPTIKLVNADQRRCRQIMLNLLSNAVKYTSESGHVEIHAGNYKDEKIKIEVSDTGIGIPGDDIDKVFSEFYQVDRKRDEQLGGTGIGLALTQRLVKMHRGEIGVKSESGKGSTFWFTLPASRNNDSSICTKNTETELPSVDIIGRRILLVEDNQVNLKMMLKTLSIKGPEIEVARNGKQAIDLAESFNPELILMDIRMPVMDGIEATRKLRSIQRFSKIPIIALSASTGIDAEHKHVAAGCTEHIPKPIQSNVLFKMLDKYLTNQK